MPHMTPDNTFVVICDWHGRLVWKSSDQMKVAIGDYGWSLFQEQDQDSAKQAFASCVTLREEQVIEVANTDGQLFRIWLWPLNAPDSAACILSVRIPQELSILTAREKECLALLAQGMSTKQIATNLKVSLSTAQTHLKRTRTKLKLPTSEALVSFAARYCHPNIGPQQSNDADA